MPTPERLQTRRSQVLELASEQDCDALLVTGATSIRYLSGFTGSAGALLLTAAGTVLATDGRYVEQAGHESPGTEIEVTRDGVVALLELAAQRGVRRLGAESSHLSWHDADRLRTLRSGALDDRIALVPTSDLVEQPRMVKDDDEIRCIRAACRITGEALLDAIAAVHAGVSERALAQVFLDGIVARGAEGPSFEPIVAIGANSSLPHHRPGTTAARPGDLVLFDVGARFEGYCADLSRTVSLGSPGAELTSMHSIVEEAQRRGVAAVAPGASVVDVDGAARAVISAAGHGEHFVHGTGHGLGLDIHEPPLIGPSADGRLGESFTVTVEPGIYLPGVGGVRIEDTVLVTADGAETLTTVPRALIEC